MLVSDAVGLLFVHVQKTGGSTIDNTLSAALPDVRTVEGVGRHATLKQILEAEPRLSGHWTVGFVRNPWARLLSWHRMVVRWQENADAGREAARHRLERDRFTATVAEKYPAFEDFVLHATEEFGRLRLPQVAYLGAGGGRRADFIGRQETLEADVRAIVARLDLEVEELRSINIDHQRPSYREVYTDAMRDRVADLFARDVAAFGYRF